MWVPPLSTSPVVQGSKDTHFSETRFSSTCLGGQISWIGAKEELQAHQKHLIDIGEYSPINKDENWLVHYWTILIGIGAHPDTVKTHQHVLLVNNSLKTIHSCGIVVETAHGIRFIDVATLVALSFEPLWEAMHSTLTQFEMISPQNLCLISWDFLKNCDVLYMNNGNSKYEISCHRLKQTVMCANSTRFSPIDTSCVFAIFLARIQREFVESSSTCVSSLR